MGWFLLLTACAPEPVASSPKREGAEDSGEDERGDTGMLAGNRRPPVRAPCETEMDPATTLKLCGGYENDYLGREVALIRGTGESSPKLLVGGGFGPAYLIQPSVGRGASYVDEEGVSALRPPAPFDVGFGAALDGAVVSGSTYVAVGSPYTWWYYDADGRAYLYDAETFGDPTAAPIAAVSGGEQMLLGTAVAVLAGTGVGPGMVIGREPWYGGSGIYQTAYIFWDTPGTNDDIAGADLTLTSLNWYSLLGDWVGAADLDGDGVDEALLSHGSGVTVVEAGLAGSMSYFDLPIVWAESALTTGSIGVADLTGDGVPEIVQAWSNSWRDWRCTIAVLPAPVGGDVSYQDALGGYRLEDVTFCHGAVVAADVAGPSDATLAFGSWDGTARQVFVHKGAVTAWLTDDDAVRIDGVEAQDNLGMSAVAILDLDGDGTREVAAGAPEAGAFDTGAVYLFWDL